MEKWYIRSSDKADCQSDIREAAIRPHSAGKIQGKNFLQCPIIYDILRMLQKNTYVRFSEGANPGKPGGLREETIRKNKTKWRKET